MFLRISKKGLSKKVAPLIKMLIEQVRQSTPLIADQCKIYIDLAHVIVNQKVKYNTPVSEAMISRWAADARQKIDDIANELTPILSDPLDFEAAKSELSYELRRMVASKLAMVSASKTSATLKRIFIFGAAGLAAYGLFKILKNGEKIEDAQKRLPKDD